MDAGSTRIVFAGGGTGGHLYPALSVAEELRRRLPSASVTFVGTRRGLEQRLVPQAGYPLVALSLGGLKGASLAGKLGAAAAAGWAVLRCTAWMLRARPDLVIGVGGYASGPGVLAAKFLRVPTMILEQNDFPGATNRWLAPWVDAVCLPSEAAGARIGGRTFVTGNPVRREFFEIAEAQETGALELLVFGGSRGAASINHAVVSALEGLARIEPAPRIVHQTGADDEESVRSAYERAYPRERFEVRAFLDDMPARLAWAGLVLCRAGALTLAELCAAGRPAILVPYPHASDDHQRHNAEALCRAGAAEMLPDPELSGELAAAIGRLAADGDRRRAMGRSARALARPDAVRRIADLAERLIGGRLDRKNHVS